MTTPWLCQSILVTHKVEDLFGFLFELFKFYNQTYVVEKGQKVLGVLETGVFVQGPNHIVINVLLDLNTTCLSDDFNLFHANCELKGRIFNWKFWFGFNLF